MECDVLPALDCLKSYLYKKLSEYNKSIEKDFYKWLYGY